LTPFFALSIFEIIEILSVVFLLYYKIRLIQNAPTFSTSLEGDKIL